MKKSTVNTIFWDYNKAFCDFVTSTFQYAYENSGKILVLFLMAQAALVNGQRSSSMPIRPPASEELPTQRSRDMHNLLDNTASLLESMQEPSDTRFIDFFKNRYVPSASEQQKYREMQDRFQGKNTEDRPCEKPAYDGPTWR